MSTLENTLNLIQERKTRIENNQINGIPFPIESFRSELPVIERGNFVVTSGQTKSGKSKLSNFIFVYNSILYAYNHPDQLRVKILYFPLEETPEEIFMQFISHLLYVKSNHKIRIDTNKIKSVDNDNLLSNDILEMIKSPEIQDILRFYDEHVEFCPDQNNVGINIRIKNYAKEHGTFEYEEHEYVDEDTGLTNTIREVVGYTPYDPDEIVIVIVDHVGLLTPTSNDGSLMKAIATLSKNMVWIKNKLRYICVCVQQQSASETGGLEAKKFLNIRPTKAGLSDHSIYV